MQISRRAAGVIASLVLTAACAGTLLAQASDAGGGSLRELTAEIRQLRVAVEQSSRTQTQAQALGIFLSAQQSRLVQVTARLDAARKELDAIAQESAAHGNQLAALETQLPQITDPQERLAVEDRTRGLKLELKTVAARDQAAKVREAEVLQAWHQEDARWNDLIARLQQIVQQ